MTKTLKQEMDLAKIWIPIVIALLAQQKVSC